MNRNKKKQDSVEKPKPGWLFLGTKIPKLTPYPETLLPWAETVGCLLFSVLLVINGRSGHLTSALPSCVGADKTPESWVLNHLLSCDAKWTSKMMKYVSSSKGLTA